jgi:hypothetical protein
MKRIDPTIDTDQDDHRGFIDAQVEHTLPDRFVQCVFCTLVFNDNKPPGLKIAKRRGPSSRFKNHLEVLFIYRVGFNTSFITHSFP